jgi:hypothetical protein
MLLKISYHTCGYIDLTYSSGIRLEELKKPRKTFVRISGFRDEI